jgi:hypothetical protein
MADTDTKTAPKDEFWKGPPSPVLAWAALDRKGNIMPASIRDSIQGVKLSCGECVPVRVLITYQEEAA